MKLKEDFIKELKQKVQIEVTEAAWKEILPDNDKIIDYYRQQYTLNSDRTVTEKWVILTERRLIELTINTKYINVTTTILEIVEIQKTYKIIPEPVFIIEVSNNIDIELRNGKRIVISRPTQKEDLNDFFRFIRNFS